MKVRSVALALACAAVGTLAGRAYADDGAPALTPLPPVDLAGSDFATDPAAPSIDDGDDDDGAIGDLENVSDPQVERRCRRDRARGIRVAYLRVTFATCSAEAPTSNRMAPQ